jgi:hypothetical protein
MMSDEIRILTAAGIERFREFLARARDGSAEAPPVGLLTDPATSAPLSPTAPVSLRRFGNRYDMGCYLADVLSGLDRRTISRCHGMWNWLTLHFFDSLCPAGPTGMRNILRPELYVIDGQYNYLRYYKHLLRTAWLAVRDHGENARVLLATKRGVRSDIEETLAASQQVFGNPTIIAAAYRLYYDPATGQPRRGAAGKSGGSPRRLTAVIQQLELTFDIRSCSPDQFLSLLPREFDRFKKLAQADSV